MLTPDWEGLYNHLPLGRQNLLGCKRDRRLAPLATESPRGDTRTVMMEPCGALPRKCSFIYLLIYWEGERPSRRRPHAHMCPKESEGSYDADAGFMTILNCGSCGSFTISDRHIRAQ
jgi:hypothetical protein